MDRIKRLLSGRRDSAGYEPLDGVNGESSSSLKKSRVDWLEYGIFVLLGIAMLWAWNMFLAAAPYFQARFANSETLRTQFQSSIITVSTITNLFSMLALTKLQRNASYPSRIVASLVLNIACFALLALFTVAFLDISPESYFAFLMLMVLVSSVATGLCQNGVFAFASGFGVQEYTQAIMTGQGIAGVLPCIVQIASVLSVPDNQGAETQESPRSACAYFGTAAGVSGLALLAFAFLLRRTPIGHGRAGPPKPTPTGAESVDDEIDAAEDMASSQISVRKVMGLWQLFLKLKWLALGVTTTFAITMMFPVYTAKITSVSDPATAPRILRPASFIPLGFLLWNIGDLAGRTAPLVPALNIVDRPATVFLMAVARVVFVPLYHLCNIRGQGAVVRSDAFYLLVVQLLFGLTNGWLGSVCMMGAAYWVEEGGREAAGAFMGLMLVLGLTIGSLLSFAAA